MDNTKPKHNKLANKPWLADVELPHVDTSVKPPWACKEDPKPEQLGHGTPYWVESPVQYEASMNPQLPAGSFDNTMSHPSGDHTQKPAVERTPSSLSPRVEEREGYDDVPWVADQLRDSYDELNRRNSSEVYIKHLDNINGPGGHVLHLHGMVGLSTILLKSLLIRDALTPEGCDFITARELARYEKPLKFPEKYPPIEEAILAIGGDNVLLGTKLLKMIEQMSTLAEVDPEVTLSMGGHPPYEHTDVTSIASVTEIEKTVKRMDKNPEEQEDILGLIYTIMEFHTAQTAHIP